MVDLEHAFLGAGYAVQIDGNFAQREDAVV